MTNYAFQNKNSVPTVIKWKVPNTKPYTYHNYGFMYTSKDIPADQLEIYIYENFNGVTAWWQVSSNDKGQIVLRATERSKAEDSGARQQSTTASVSEQRNNSGNSF